MYENYLLNNNFKQAIQTIENIKNETFSLNNYSSITAWFRQYIELTPISLSLYANMFPNTQSIMVNNYKKHKKYFKNIVNEEISLKKKLVNDFLKSKQCFNKRNFIKDVLEKNHTYDQNFQKYIFEFFNVLNSISISYMEKYIGIYVKMILDSSKLEGYLLFNHMIQRFIYFIDTKCYIDDFNIKYRQANLNKNHAFPMFSKSFSYILRKRKYKPSDSLKIDHYFKKQMLSTLNIGEKKELLIDNDSDSEFEFELSVSDDEN